MTVAKEEEGTRPPAMQMMGPLTSDQINAGHAFGSGDTARTPEWGSFRILGIGATTLRIVCIGARFLEDSARTPEWGSLRIVGMGATSFTLDHLIYPSDGQGMENMPCFLMSTYSCKI